MAPVAEEEEAAPASAEPDAATPASADAAAAAPGDQGVKVETEDTVNQAHDDDELPDFGDGEEPAAAVLPPKTEAPSRAMPDYADLDDDDCAAVGSFPATAKKEEPEADARPDAMVLTGVQRLTRGHLVEIFNSKSLPVFDRLEWIADDKVVCIFPDREAASKALGGALAGFETADDRPGPGLWRAVRGMIDFKEATVADVPANNFKRQHRAGRQVRDFRFWEAAKDIDAEIFEKLDSKGIKRPAPSGEDAIAAAVFTSQLEAPKKKRRKAAAAAQSEAEVPDLLLQMAQKDKQLMALKAPKEEPTDDAEPTAELSVRDAVPDISDMPQESWEDSWFSKPSDAGDEDAWGRHAQEPGAEEEREEGKRGLKPDKPAGEGDGAANGRDRDKDRSDQGANEQWRHDRFGRNEWDEWSRGIGAGGNNEASSRKRDRDSDRDRGDASRSSPPKFKELDDEEKRKRQRRMERFSRTAAATDEAAAPAAEAAAPADEAPAEAGATDV
eukprot:TRINITY_DN5617_c0_g1_i3.p1 TRINITY_DN5617_c0_g1~~TRINITY_DN5617_c0_g1_i3.p1  ORF type:complete len:511 (-),score=149.08 TRINITY_DN5617_c0_g1_i3:47-1546(-)